MGDHAEDEQPDEASQVDAYERSAAPVGATKLDREPGAEEEREQGEESLGRKQLDRGQEPRGPARPLPGCVMEMDQEHAGEGDAAEDVQCVDASLGLEGRQGSVAHERW